MRPITSTTSHWSHDLAALAVVIQQTGAVLVGLYPLSAYLGERDSYKDSEIAAS